MRVTRAQWAILGGVVVLFVLALLAITSGGDDDGDDAPTFDEVAWCRAASGVSGRAGVLDPAFDGDAADEAANLVIELEAAILVAPETLQPDLARVLDYVRLLQGQLARGAPLPDALAGARAETDQPRLDESLTSVSAALVDCGADPLPAAALAAA